MSCALVACVVAAVGYSYWKKTEFDAEHYFDAKPLASEAAAGTAAAAGGGGGGGGGGSVDGASRLGPADLPWTGDEDALARDCGALIEELRGSFFAGHSRPLRTRLRELRNLLRMFEENEDAMLEALAADLGRPRQEGLLYDILIPKAEINHMIAHLHDWVRCVRNLGERGGMTATKTVNDGTKKKRRDWGLKAGWHDSLGLFLLSRLSRLSRHSLLSPCPPFPLSHASPFAVRSARATRW